MKSWFSKKQHTLVRGFGDNTGAVIGLLSILGVMRLLPFGNRMRNVLPEPFDLINHISNLFLSIGIGYYLVMATATLLYFYSVNPKKALLVSRIFTFCFVVILNALFETQTGIELVCSTSTPDGIDLAYGAIGGLVGV